MKRLFVFLCLFVAITLWSDDADIGELNFLPVRYYVGDVVDLRIRVTYSGSPDIRPPNPLPQKQYLLVRDVKCTRVRGDDWEVRILFSSFQTGSQILPIIDLGPVSLPGIRTETRSILEEDAVDRIAGFRPQMTLPGTRSLIIATLAFLICFPPAAWLIYRTTSRALLSYKEARDRRQPRNRIRQTLNELLKNMKALDPRSFFLTLTNALRRYLADRLNVPALTATTGEIRRLLPMQQLESSLNREVISLFSRADLVKFGSSPSNEEEMSLAIERVRGLVDQMEASRGDL